jgi:hypothetical protein
MADGGRSRSCQPFAPRLGTETRYSSSAERTLYADDPYACDDHEKHSAIAQQLWERCWYGMTLDQQAQWKRDHPQ